MANSLGRLFTITSFGESHGIGVGVIIDGCPAGLPLTEADFERDMERRRPGASPSSTPRAEEDRVEILSGVMSGCTTGAPICLMTHNRDKDSTPYEKTRFLARPGHADYTAFIKYGGYNDFRGGGRFSGRITAGFVMAGAVAKSVLKTADITVLAHTVELGGIKAENVDTSRISEASMDKLSCADPKAAEKMAQAIAKAKHDGDSLGGVIEAVALGVPPGVGEPVFDTIDGELAKALMAIPAVKGVEFGAGFAAASKHGSENNDPFRIKDGSVVTETNNCGGVLGGISNGMPVVMRVAVKPTPSIERAQRTVDMKVMKNAELEVKGRHDVTVVPRAVVVVEAMTAVTLCDLGLRAQIIPRIIK